MGDVGDDHFYEFIWKAAGRFVCDTAPWRRITEDIGPLERPDTFPVVENVITMPAGE